MPYLTSRGSLRYHGYARGVSITGAKKSLELAKKYKIKKAIMKSKSPSCGCGLIHDGHFSKKLKPGFGVAAACLKKNGIEVMSDVEYLMFRI
ncbi:MAG: DUF523 domain-containing protein [Candidatus Omnitrophota bacterium]